MSKQRATAEKRLRGTGTTQVYDETLHHAGTEPSSIILQTSVRQFITEHRAASLATTDPAGTPHVAIVFCVIHEDLSVYFSTRVEGRKFKNIMEQPIVAMAFSHESAVQMVQLSGIARRVEDLQTEQSVLRDLMKRRYDDPNWPPPPVQLFDRGATNEIAVIEVVPTELTFADFQSGGAGRYKPFFYKVV